MGQVVKPILLPFQTTIVHAAVPPPILQLQTTICSIVLLLQTTVVHTVVPLLQFLQT